MQVIDFFKYSAQYPLDRAKYSAYIMFLWILLKMYQAHMLHQVSWQ